MPIRTTFYIDGFNFYNGCKSAIHKIDPRWKVFYWIDFVQLTNQFIDKNHELVAVKYFTASPLDEEKEKRQSALFKANKFINDDKFQIIKGKYYKKPIRCLADCRKSFEIYEEKRTDVNISVEIMGDCAFDKTDKIVLISADSDLVPTLEYVMKNYSQKKIKIYFPPLRKSTDLMKLVDKVVFLDSNRLKFEKAVMPDVVNVNGNVATIPNEWRISSLTP